MKAKSIALALLLLVLSLLASPVSAEHTQTLVVYKYGLTPGATSFIESQTKADGTKINGIPVDNKGNQLKPMANISYVVSQIIPTGDDAAIATENPDPASYQIVKPWGTMTTDANGYAAMSLPDGEYLIQELKNPAVGLKDESPPAVVRLPLPGSSEDEVKDTVYMYPKSNVDPPAFQPKPSSSEPLGDGAAGAPQGLTNQKKKSDFLGQYLPKMSVDESIGMLSLGLLLLLLLILYKRYFPGQDEKL